jgi:glycerophosphoryl diester phosphodiesterase
MGRRRERSGVLPRVLAFVSLAIVLLVVVWLVCGVRRRAETRKQRRGRCIVDSPLVTAHRGASKEAPENTLEALRLAVELGADAVKVDAQLTRDGAVVLSHDGVWTRGRRGVPRWVRECSSEEVRGWRVEGGAEAMPLLSEVLTAMPEASFVVDVKSSGRRAADEVVRVVRRCGATGRTTLCSFSGATLRRVRELGYEGRTGLAPSEALRLLTGSEESLRTWPVAGRVAHVPQSFQGLDMGTRGIIDRCHTFGVEVHFWTVNDTAAAKRLLDAGADGIITDDVRGVGEVVRRYRKI